MTPMAKPHRFLLERVSSYRSEARAFANRKRIRGLPFVRARYAGGVTAGVDPDSDRGRLLLARAEELLDELDGLNE